MQYRLQQLAQCLDIPLPTPPQDRIIRHWLIDSRQLIEPASTLFFALPGRRVDGHNFIGPLYRQGVRAFVVTHIPPDCPEAIFIAVPNVLTALQQLTAFHRQQFDIPVIGITGSNGKTIVKEWLKQLLLPDYPLAVSPRSYNSQIGVPLSVALLDHQHELAILEAGISQAGEMEALARMIQPTIGLFTNLGAAHQEGFSSRAAKLTEKLKLFQSAEVLIYKRDQEEVHLAIQEQISSPTFCWSSDANAEVQLLSIDVGIGQSSLQIAYQGAEYEFSIPFTDPNAHENAMHCACVLLFLGLPTTVLRERMPLLDPVHSRLEVRAGQWNSVLIDDTYSNDLTSLAAALNLLDQQAADGRPKLLILSDLLESGLPQQALYQQVAQLIRGRVDEVIGIGPAIRTLAEALPASLAHQFYADTEDALAHFPVRSIQGAAVLIKGARSFQLERLSNRLTQQVHRTELEIDQNALLHNLAVFQEQLHPQVKLAAMVKAAAYGSGGPEIGRLLEQHGVDYLVVAYPDEGRELRQAGIRAPILILNAESHTLPLLLEWQLEPEVYHWQQLLAWADTATPLRIHLKFDTGMNRLGFAPAEAARLGAWFQQHPSLEVASAMTHLAASDAAAHDAFTHQQVAQFQQAYQQLQSFLDYQPDRHVLNTSGIARFPAYQFEMVRLGIGLYGIENSDRLSDRLQHVLQLQARISQIRWVEAGATVGYNRAGQVDRRTRVATLSIGYADGLPRAAGNGCFQVRIQEQWAPIIGAVCMDMTMVDVTHITSVAEGDVAIIFGSSPTVQALAAAANTIPYEILTNISARVHRVYIQE